MLKIKDIFNTWKTAAVIFTSAISNDNNAACTVGQLKQIKQELGLTVNMPDIGMYNLLSLLLQPYRLQASGCLVSTQKGTDTYDITFAMNAADCNKGYSDTSRYNDVICIRHAGGYSYMLYLPKNMYCKRTYYDAVEIDTCTKDLYTIYTKP